ncbi:jg8787 [Pararge aegeria aegeria]|uniref:Jg8787 protein n=1 Tax=Pararge aegeria aegeria TaxID=348720 RepID=A0A8S4RXN7_9NEOP|nr:jg8787 [Pararge aegeria aegeria]
MTSGESLGAVGGKRPRNVDSGTPYDIPMSSSGRQLVELMMMMFCVPGIELGLPDFGLVGGLGFTTNSILTYTCF